MSEKTYSVHRTRFYLNPVLEQEACRLINAKGKDFILEGADYDRWSKSLMRIWWKNINYPNSVDSMLLRLDANGRVDNNDMLKFVLSNNGDKKEELCYICAEPISKERLGYLVKNNVSSSFWTCSTCITQYDNALHRSPATKSEQPQEKPKQSSLDICCACKNPLDGIRIMALEIFAVPKSERMCVRCATLSGIDYKFKKYLIDAPKLLPDVIIPNKPVYNDELEKDFVYIK